MTIEAIIKTCSILSAIAVVFSYLTMFTHNWRWYVPTVLFGVASLVLGVYGMVAF